MGARPGRRLSRRPARSSPPGLAAGRPRGLPDRAGPSDSRSVEAVEEHVRQQGAEFVRTAIREPLVRLA